MEMKKWLGPQDKEFLRGDGYLSMLDMSEFSTSLTIVLDVCVCVVLLGDIDLSDDSPGTMPR